MQLKNFYMTDYMIQRSDGLSSDYPSGSITLSTHLLTNVIL